MTFTDPRLLYCIPGGNSQRFENVAFTSSGRILGAANAHNDSVLLFRRGAEGRFEEEPYCIVGGPESKLLYPHDLSFATYNGTELLAVTQRRGAVTFFARDPQSDEFSSDPVFEISGLQANLHYSDAGSFVPPDNKYFAACNMEHGSVSFFRRKAQSSTDFETRPVFEMRIESPGQPDGLAFSQCGRWLAVANHGNHSVEIFQRHDGKYSSDGISEYDPRPVVTINDALLHHPHSIAFSKTDHILVANAGANYISVFEPESTPGQWRQTPVLIKRFTSDEIFRAYNSRNRMEGGPKGVAVHDNHLAVCSPAVGINLYEFHESRAAADVLS